MAEQLHNDVGAGWPGGWYVYENGKIEGPFTAAEAFKLSAETSDGKPRLVSRKGFSQWYALKDLSEIFKMTEQMGRRASEEQKALEEQLEQLRASVQGASTEVGASMSVSMSAPASVVMPYVPPPPAKRVESAAAEEAEAPPAKRAQPDPPRVDRGTKGKKSASLAAPASAPQPQPLASAPVAAAAAAKGEVASILSAPSRAPEKDRSKDLARNAVLQEFFLQRGRLRLGKLRNPWITSFVGLPLTLGVLWAVWYGELARETAWHARGSEKSPLPPAFLALVPFVHVYMIYRLAELVAEMEGQNKYRNVSPGLAAALALVPPVAMAYLQDAANRHWLLHTRHALAKKSPKAI